MWSETMEIECLIDDILSIITNGFDEYEVMMSVMVSYFLHTIQYMVQALILEES